MPLCQKAAGENEWAKGGEQASESFAWNRRRAHLKAVLPNCLSKYSKRAAIHCRMNAPKTGI